MSPRSAYDWQREVERDLERLRSAAARRPVGLVPVASLTTVTSTSWVDTHKALLLSGGGVVGARAWCLAGTLRVRLSWSAAGVTRTTVEYETPAGEWDDLELDVDEQAAEDTPVFITVQARVVSGSAQFAVASSWS